MKFRAACIQLCSSTDVGENIATVERLTREAVHRGNDRHLECLVSIEQHAVLDFARRATELANIGSREERRAFTHQDDTTNRN